MQTDFLVFCDTKLGDKGFETQSVPAPGTGFHGAVCPCWVSIHVIASQGAVPEGCGRILLQPLGRDPHGQAGCCLVGAVRPP